MNLLLNRASSWADVDSHIPYTGRVDVKVKQPLELFVRIPEWATPDQVRCVVGAQNRPLRVRNRYVQVGAVKPTEVVTLTFPIAERVDEMSIEKQKYTLIRKGNEVVHIDPQGTECPLYQRAHYRENQAPSKKVTRFVSRETMEW